MWRARLSPEPDHLALLSRCLDEDERRRAARFHFRRDQERFVASRSQVRYILAQYLGTTPEGIRFAYSPEGRPFLLEHPGLDFNVSHAGDLLLVAIARGCRIGVDVEGLMSLEVTVEVGRLILSPPERGILQRLPGEHHPDWFTRVWTRKEAYIKADGRGMSIPLEHVDVATEPGRVRLRASSSEEWSLSQSWAVRSVPVSPGYGAAVVCEKLEWELACFDWP